MFNRVGLISGVLLLCLSVLSVPAYASTVADARQLMDQGHEGEAVAMLQQIVRQSDGKYQAWFLLGVAYARQHQYHEAIQAFRKVSELRPDLAEPHNNLAVIYNELGDLRAAVNELEISIAKNPDYATAQENIGDLYVKLALQSYQKSLVQAPNPQLQARYDRLLQVRMDMPNAKVDGHRDHPSVDGAGQATAAAPAAVPAIQERPEVKPAQEAVAATKAESQTPAVEPVKKPAPEEVVADIKTENITPATNVQNAGESVAVLKNEMQDADPAAPVLAAVEVWRQAWSDRNANVYLAAYGQAFRPGGDFANRSSWERYKRRVIGAKKFIDVKLDDIRVSLVDDHTARVSFLQHFRSNNYNSDDRKELTLTQVGDGWKIIDEKTL